MEQTEETARVAGMIQHYRERVRTLETQLNGMTISRREALARAHKAERLISDMMIERYGLLELAERDRDTAVSKLRMLYRETEKP